MKIKRIMIPTIIMGLLFITACSSQTGESSSEQNAEANETVSPTPETFAEYTFAREDKNPADLAVGMEEKYLAYSEGEFLEYEDILHKESGGVVESAYTEEERPKEEDYAGYIFFKRIDSMTPDETIKPRANVIYSIRYRKDDEYQFKLKRKEWIDYEEYYYTLVQDIEQFLYTEDNVIYYIKNGDEVWSYDMGADMEQYLYDYVPEVETVWDEDVMDVTQDYLSHQ